MTRRTVHQADDIHVRICPMQIGDDKIIEVKYLPYIIAAICIFTVSFSTPSYASLVPILGNFIGFYFIYICSELRVQIYLCKSPAIEIRFQFSALSIPFSGDNKLIWRGVPTPMLSHTTRSKNVRRNLHHLLNAFCPFLSDNNVWDLIPASAERIGKNVSIRQEKLHLAYKLHPKEECGIIQRRVPRTHGGIIDDRKKGI